MKLTLAYLGSMSPCDVPLIATHIHSSYPFQIHASLLLLHYQSFCEQGEKYLVLNLLCATHYLWQVLWRNQEEKEKRQNINGAIVLPLDNSNKLEKYITCWLKVYLGIFLNTSYIHYDSPPIQMTAWLLEIFSQIWSFKYEQTVGHTL